MTVHGAQRPRRLLCKYGSGVLPHFRVRAQYYSIYVYTYSLLSKDEADKSVIFTSAMSSGSALEYVTYTITLESLLAS